MSSHTTRDNRVYAQAKTWSPLKGYEFAPHQHPDRLEKIPAAEIVFVPGKERSSRISEVPPVLPLPARSAGGGRTDLLDSKVPIVRAAPRAIQPKGRPAPPSLLMRPDSPHGPHTGQRAQRGSHRAATGRVGVSMDEYTIITSNRGL